MSQLNFNLAGDPGDDQPTLVADLPPGGTTLSTHFEGVPGKPPNRFVAIVPKEIFGGATLTYDHGRKTFRVIVPPGEGQWEANLPPCMPPEYGDDKEKVALFYGPPKPKAREGVVTIVGKAWTDAGGPYYPLGDTLLYALGHWHRGGALRDLVKENLTFIASYGHDYIRILGEVNWAGAEIDPTWPDYESHLAELVDYAYDTHGLRTKITVTGGGNNPWLAAQKVTNVLAGRVHKIQLVESVNEDNASGADAIWIAKLAKTVGVAVATGRGDVGLDTIIEEGNAAGSHVDILHTERGLGPNGPDEVGGPHARQIRQAWDFHKFSRASEDGEPPGPTSSVAVLDDPMMLASKRVASIVCGAGAFCLHGGYGVYGAGFGSNGYQSSAGYRHAHFKDVPNIDAIMKAVRNADKHLPKGIENWSKFNNNQPVQLVRDGLVNKLFGCTNGVEFVEIGIGTSGPAPFKAMQPCQVKFFAPTGEVLLEQHFNAGEVSPAFSAWSIGIVGTLG